MARRRATRSTPGWTRPPRHARDSTALVHFSGHGVRVRGTDRYYLLPADGVKTSGDELARTAILNAELSARLRKIPRGAAHRGARLLPRLGAGERRAVGRRGSSRWRRGAGVVVLAAASNGAYKVEERNSAFTHHCWRGCAAGPRAWAADPRMRSVPLRAAEVRGRADPQQPIFKAELEEDYPIARYRDARAEIPAAPDALQYDAFISYCSDDYDDRDWVEEVMVPRLERWGLRVCIETRDFRLSAPLIEEAEAGGGAEPLHGGGVHAGVRRSSRSRSTSACWRRTWVWSRARRG